MKLKENEIIYRECFLCLLVLCVCTAKRQFHELAGAKEEKKEINSDPMSRANITKYELASS